MIEPIKAFDAGQRLQISSNFVEPVRLILHTASSLGKGIQKSSKLTDEMTQHSILPGFTGKSFRHFLNSLCELKDCVYLEVGSYVGSSLVSSLHGNYDQIKHAYAIDNWSEFNGGEDPKKFFKKVLGSFIPEYGEDKLTVIENDCFSVNLSEIKEKVNIYFYDGHHSKESHKKAFTYFNDVLCDTFIAVVDDWEKGAVKEGTREAFEELGYKILATWEIVPPPREKRLDHPEINWWHGVSVSVVQK
jgi:hypothetical protein